MGKTTKQKNKNKKSLRDSATSLRLCGEEESAASTLEEDTLAHLAKTRIRYADTDQMGYVHHAKYLEYFEIGRTEYMRARGASYAQMEESGVFLVLTEAHARYRSTARYDTEISIRTRLTEVSHTQVTFEYSVEDDEGKVFCEGWTKLACIDGNGKIRRIPEKVRECLKEDGQ